MLKKKKKKKKILSVCCGKNSLGFEQQSIERPVYGPGENSYYIVFEDPSNSQAWARIFFPPRVWGCWLDVRRDLSSKPCFKNLGCD